MKIMVTGAAGFIGSHTVDRLLEEGHEVLGVDNLRTGRLANLTGAARSNKFRFEEGDIAQPGLLDRLSRATSAAAVVHLAGLVSVQESLSNPDLNYLLNVEATHLVGRLAMNSNVQRIVFASSAAVYGRGTGRVAVESAPKWPLSPYGWSKLASEALLFGAAQAAAKTALCLRYFNVYGPRQDPRSSYAGVLSIFRDKIASGEAISVFGTGSQTRDFVHVDDVAKANVLAATSPDLQSAPLNICTERGVSLNEIIRMMQELQSKEVRVEHHPSRDGDIEHSCGNAQAARQALGFEAKIRLEDGLKDAY